MQYIDHFLFYTNRVALPYLYLDGEETKHATVVLRIQKGATIFVTDGHGSIHTCFVEEIDGETGTCRILSTQMQERQKPLLLFFIGMPDKDAFESLCNSLAPLGVERIQPVICKHCQRQWWEKSWEKHAARLQKKMISAVKQSWNAWLPLLEPPVTFDKGLLQSSNVSLVADAGGVPLDESLRVFQSIPDTIHCWIGPPGGFSTHELDMLQKRHAAFTRIAPYRLRTELAALVLASALVQRYVLKNQGTEPNI